VCLIRCRWAWILGLWLLVAPTDGWASTVSTRLEYGDEFPWVYATFAADRGERNRLTVRWRQSNLVFRDTGSRVRARGRCKSLGPHSASCRAYSLGRVSLRNRNDRFRLRGFSGAFSAVDGGRGNDVLRGGDGQTALDGGPGRDRLYGHLLVDGETDAQAAPDLFNARPAGSGSVDFSRRETALRIDLGGGRTSTGDTIVGVRKVVGGSGDDQITGDASDNTLRGGLGADVIDGGSGDDESSGGPGDDRLSGDIGNDELLGGAGRDGLDGGSGDDVLSSNEPVEVGGTRTSTAPDEVACGDGADEVLSDASDTLEPACELMLAGEIRLRTAPTWRAGRAEFTADWTGVGSTLGTIGTLRLRGPAGEEFGTAGYVGSFVGLTIVSVPLTSSGIAALQAGTVVQVDLIPDGAMELFGYRMFLQAG
jgi:Ca2+-binding RTX toxin-like protein